MQRESDTKKLYVIGYASRSLRPGEKNYIAFQLESAALLFGCRAFHSNLWGKSFILMTDHAAILSLRDSQSARAQKWKCDLSEFSFTAVHVAGSKHGLPDGLSRFPLEGENMYFDDPTPNDVLGTWVGPADDKIVVINSVKSDIITPTRSSSILDVMGVEQCAFLIARITKLEIADERYSEVEDMVKQINVIANERPRRNTKPRQFL